MVGQNAKLIQYFNMHPSAARVQESLSKLGLACEVQELPDNTASAADAAAAIGSTVSQIAKSLVLSAGQETILVIASGSNRISLEKISALTGQRARMARADDIKRITGFSIGGIPPLGHDLKLRTFIDADLFNYTEIWAAAGTTHAVFRTSAQDLLKATGGEKANIKL